MTWPDAVLAGRLFVELRPLWREARLILLGHALLEKLVSPKKAAVAHVYHALKAIKFQKPSMTGWPVI